MKSEPGAGLFPNLRLSHLVTLLLLLGGGYLLLVRGVLPGLTPPLGDFANYYTAARVVVEGQPLSEAYLDPLWFQKQIDRQGIVGQLGGFIPHPPPAALVMVPLTPFAPVSAKQIWTVLNLALLGLAIWILKQLSGLAPAICGVLVLLSGPALWHNFAFGQLYLLLLVSLLASLFFQARGRPVLAGISLGLLIPVKYFGAPWLVYWAWRREWRLVVAGVLTAGAVALVTWLLVGPEPFVWFWRQVLPRHLAGEIQDPYAQGFQSWNSLYRRLFLYDRLLNPHPAWESSGVFLVARHLTFWTLLAWGLSLVSTRAEKGSRNSLRDSAWMVTVLLLLSPAGATYHFVLLVLAAVFFAAHSWICGRPHLAVLMAALFCLVNLPHFLYLEFLAEGWWNPGAYPRLWSLLLFALAGAWSTGVLRRGFSRRWVVVALAGFLVSVGADALRRTPEDGARLLPVEGPEMDRRLGLVMTEPNPVAGELAFSYIEGAAGRYAPFDGVGRRRIPPVPASYFNPRLHTDGRRLLVETWRDGTPSVELSTDRDLPQRVAWGDEAVWLGDGSRIAFVSQGKLKILDAESGEVDSVGDKSAAGAPPIPNALSNSTTRIRYLSSSADGRQLAYCRQTGEICALALFDLEPREERIAASFEAPLRNPQISPDGATVALSRYGEGNWDIWVFTLGDGRWQRLTRHPAVDGHPSWASDRKLIFTSDRGRGLGFTVLYEIEF